jgi:hypothetical protein
MIPMLLALERMPKVPVIWKPSRIASLRPFRSSRINSVFSNSYANGDVTGDNYVGGLVGVNNGTISQSYYSAEIWGKGNYRNGSYTSFGGLVGSNAGTILNSHATPKLTVNQNSYVGGLVGFNSGTIDKSYSNPQNIAFDSGSPIGTGGLVGTQASSGYITNSYSTGNIYNNIGAANTGGFIGINNAGGRVENSYSSTLISASGCNVTCNGFAGLNSGTLTNTFWNVTTSSISRSNGQAISIDSTAMQSLATFSNQGWNSSIWQVLAGVNNGFPTFKSNVLYVRSSQNSSIYGNQPNLDYSFYDLATGGNIYSNSSAINKDEL